jgi:hypothetical protein
MDLLERYLQAVGRYLPEETRQDTVAELRANLLEQMDARAEELGRPLDDSDVAAILKEHGKPELVALRYLPQRSLIGPTIFPFYLFTLRRSLPLVVFVYAVAQAAALMFSGDGGDLAGRIVVAVFKLVPVLLVFAAIVTLAFVLVEYLVRRGSLKSTLNEWDPMALPSVKVKAEATGVKPRSMVKRVVDLCVHCLWMAYVLIIPTHPFWLLGPGVFYLSAQGLRFAPVWHVFFGSVIVLLVVQLGMKLLALMPRTDAWMKPLDLVANVIGVVALGMVAFAKESLVAASPAVDLQRLAAVNHGISAAMKVALVFAVIGLVAEGWKYGKRWAPVKGLAF